MEEAKQEILDKCLLYYFRYGIRKMSNKRLVALLGISTKTLYRHFKNKEDLLFLALEMFYYQQYESFKKLSKEVSAVVLLYNLWKKGFAREFEVNSMFYHDLNHYYPEVEKRIDSKNNRRFGKKFIQIIRRGVLEGDFRKDINPKVVIRTFSVLYISTVRKGDFDKLRLQADEVFQSTMVPYFRGICTGTGLEKLDRLVLLSPKINSQL